MTSNFKSDVLIQRLDFSDQGTFGRLITRAGYRCYTGELPWRDNRPSISCVPPGFYQVLWSMSPRFGRFMYLVSQVPSRSGIRKHSANLMGDAAMGYYSQLNGCIALGKKLGWLDGQKALLLSGTAMREFEKHMGGKPFILEIRND